MRFDSFACTSQCSRKPPDTFQLATAFSGRNSGGGARPRPHNFMSANWNCITAISTMAAAIAAAVAAVVAYCQMRQAGAISKATAQQAMELAKFNAEYSSIQSLDDTWQSQRMIAVRRGAAEALLRGEQNSDVDQILDFFEEIARLVRRGILPVESAWHAYYWPIANYWSVTSAYAKRAQVAEGASWKDLPGVIAEMQRVEARESNRPIEAIAPSNEQTETFLRDECQLEIRE